MALILVTTRDYLAFPAGSSLCRAGPARLLARVSHDTHTCLKSQLSMTAIAMPISKRLKPYCHLTSQPSYLHREQQNQY